MQFNCGKFNSSRYIRFDFINHSFCMRQQCSTISLLDDEHLVMKPIGWNVAARMISDLNWNVVADAASTPFKAIENLHLFKTYFPLELAINVNPVS